MEEQEDVDIAIVRQREKALLTGLEKAGMLSDKDRKRLEYIRTQEQQEINYLEYKEKEDSLSEEEKNRLEKIRETILAEKQANEQNAEDEDY